MIKRSSWVLAVVSILALQGCRPSNSDIGRQVTTSMQGKFDSDAQFRNLHLAVQSVSVVHSNGNLYEGIAKISARGVEHDIPIKITADGQNMVWETEPGALLVFLADDVPPSSPTDERTAALMPLPPSNQEAPSMPAAPAYTIAGGMGFRYHSYPHGYMVNQLCSSTQAGFCYSFGWQDWVKQVEIKTAGADSSAVQADAGVASPGNTVISWDSQERIVFGGCRPHECPSASAYFIVSPETQEMDIVWQRESKITYLGPDSALLQSAHAYEWLKQIELVINEDQAREYEQTHP